MENEYEFDLKRLIGVFLRKWWIILLVAFLGGVIGFCYSKFGITPKYESHVSMYVRSKNDVSESVSVSLSDMNMAKSLVNTYIAVLKDDAVMNEVGTKILEEYGEEQTKSFFKVDEKDGTLVIKPKYVRKCFSMAAVDSTELLKITANTKDAYLSAFLCETMADLAPDFLIRVVGAGSIETIGPAVVELQKVSPSNAKNAVIGAAIAFVLVAGVIFLMEYLNNTIKDKEMMEKRYGKAIIGEIAEFSSGKYKKKSRFVETRAIDFGKDTPFYVVEAYKAMRTNLQFALATAPKKVVAVSSSNPGEGKSTTIANLAVTLAQTGKKVLLIDADLRKPTQQKQFNLPNKNGLSDLIGKMTSLEKALQKEVVENLDVITSGPQPPNPSELLSSPQMKELLGKLEDKYDYVLIDTPPVNVVSDVLGLGDAIGGIFLVVRHAKTNVDDVDNALQKVEFAKMSMLGFVLNDIERKHSGGYGYRYSSKYAYYRSYSNDDTEKKKNLSKNK